MMQYYYATPGAVEGLSGVKEEAAKYVQKIRDAFNSMGLGGKRLDETQRNLDALAPLVQALPSGADRDDAGRQFDAMQGKVSELRGKVDKMQGDLKRLWDELKSVLGFSGLSGPEEARLGIVWYVLVGLVAAALIGAAKLWQEVVNETGRMNTQAKALKAVIEGKLPPEVLRDLKKEGTGGVLAMLPKIAIAAVVLFALPGLVKMGRRSA